MILKIHNVPFDSQKQILEECGRGIGIKGTIDSYFRRKQIPLSCVDFRVQESFPREFELFVGEALNNGCDLLIMYACEALYPIKEEINHASLLVGFDGKNATLLNPYFKEKDVVGVPFDKLIYALFKGKDGFHCIHPDSNILKNISKNYC